MAEQGEREKGVGDERRGENERVWLGLAEREGEERRGELI